MFFRDHVWSVGRHLMRQKWIVGIVALAAVVAFAFWWTQFNRATQVASETSSPTSADPDPNRGDAAASPEHVRVDVVRPRLGSMARSNSEPGTVKAFEYADLLAKVSGYLEEQKVDIGDTVKAGQLLAKISAPELVQAVDQAKAQLLQADAQVNLMEAGIVRALADVDAAQANIVEKQADLRRATAYLTFRQIQYERISHLYNEKAIEEKLVDENRKERDASLEAESAARAAISTAQAEFAAKKARVVEARADLANAKAKVQVAAAVLEKAKVYVGYLEIHSPYNGVVTKRSFHVGDFIRTAEQGGETPMLVVARTDLMRVVMKMPETYVPYTDAGDAALVELDALAGKQFHGKVARIANSLDPVDRTMRVEVDLKNTSNELRDGMFGRVTVYLTRSTKELSIPSTSLMSDPEGKGTSVYIVRDGRTQRVPVKVGRDNGIQAEILLGLQPNDLVVRHPTADLLPDESVEAVQVDTGSGAAKAAK
jgi:RND family efflux transporter MFP subunit